jgi:ribosomal protein S18 acetylase RimI-like enzyme
MPTIRPYLDSDWDAVLELCILAFTPVHESFERLLGTEFVRLVYPDWKTSNKDYLRSLSDSGEKDRFLVAEQNGLVVGFIHYEVDSTKQRGTIGINAVHPAHQSKGIGSLMYGHVQIGSAPIGLQPRWAPLGRMMPIARQGRPVRNGSATLP